MPIVKLPDEGDCPSPSDDDNHWSTN